MSAGFIVCSLNFIKANSNAFSGPKLKLRKAVSKNINCDSKERPSLFKFNTSVFKEFLNFGLLTENLTLIGLLITSDNTCKSLAGIS